MVAEQVAELLACSVDTLLDRRRDGKPPPFRQEKVRGRVKYPLGGVLAERRSNVFSSSDQARAAHRAEALGYPAPIATAGASTFAAFIDSALPKDEWLFTFVDGKPTDFFTSLGVEQSDDGDIACRWLSLIEYLDERSLGRPSGIRGVAHRFGGIDAGGRCSGGNGPCLSMREGLWSAVSSWA